MGHDGAPCATSIRGRAGRRAARTPRQCPGADRSRPSPRPSPAPLLPSPAMSIAWSALVSLAERRVIQNDRSYCMLVDVPRRSVADVAHSRASAVEAAVDLASVEGLEGITIGRLARDLGMSKSGLIGRFGDKQAMQRAVLATAVERFTDAV